MDSTGLVLALAIASSVFGAVAALAAAFQVVVARRATQVQVYLTFQERYAADDMNTALATLKLWAQSSGNNFAKTWLSGYQRNDERALSLNGFRRMVSSYFVDLATAIQLGALPKQLAQRLIADAGHEVFAEICVPMNEQLYGRPWGPHHLAELRKITAPRRTLLTRLGLRGFRGIAGA